MTWDRLTDEEKRERARELAFESARLQGLPEQITDRADLAPLARLLTASDPTVANSPAAAAPCVSAAQDEPAARELGAAEPTAITPDALGGRRQISADPTTRNGRALAKPGRS